MLSLPSLVMNGRVLTFLKYTSIRPASPDHELKIIWVCGPPNFSFTTVISKKTEPKAGPAWKTPKSSECPVGQSWDLGMFLKLDSSPTAPC